MLLNAYIARGIMTICLIYITLSYTFVMFNDKDNYENSPSLDRIDNEKGYIKGNIQVITNKANSMKNCATLDELKVFCKNMLIL